MPGTSAPSWSGSPTHPAEIRGVRDAGVLGLQDGVGDVRALVGITDDEVDARSGSGTGCRRRRPPGPGSTGRQRNIILPISGYVSACRMASIRRHLTPDVQSPAAVGVAHDDVAAGAGVTLGRGSSTPSPCRSWPGRDPRSPRHGRQDDVPAGVIRRGHVTQRLLDQCRIRVGAFTELRKRTRAPGGRGRAAAGGPSRGSAALVVTAATRRCDHRQHGDDSDDPDDPDPLHVPPPCGSMALATR